jgi:hypothetical protein
VCAPLLLPRRGGSVLSLRKWPELLSSAVEVSPAHLPGRGPLMRETLLGDGFVRTHATMDSLEAMDHIDRMFLSIDESIRLPQWSFDFWIIPYLIGKGISLAHFKEFMECAHKLLSLETASVPGDQKARLQRQYLQRVIEQVGRWSLTVQVSAA